MGRPRASFASPAPARPKEYCPDRPDGQIKIPPRPEFPNGARAPDLARLPAADLIDPARRAFGQLIGARVDRLGSLEHQVPGLFVTGNYLRGPSVAVCLAGAQETAGHVDAFLDRFEQPARRRQML